MHTFVLLLTVSQSSSNAQIQPGEVIPAIVADIAENLPDSEYYRYVYIHDGRKNAAAYVNTTINQVLSSSGNVVNATSISNNILRLDIRLLQSRHIAGVWERFRDDEPYFLANNTSEIVELRKDIAIVTVVTNVQSGTTVTGIIQPGEYEVLEQKPGWLRISQGWIQSNRVAVHTKSVDKVTRHDRVFGPHLPAETITIAHPIVRYDYFLRKAWSSDAIGLYYDFRGITPAPQGSGLSDYEFFLKDFAGVTEAELQRFGIDPFKKVAMLDSKVTGKPRAVILFSGAGSKVNNNQGLIAVTQDGRDNDDVGRDTDPFRNLLQHRFNAMEVFVEMPNGTIAYALFTGDLDGNGVFDAKKGEGKLQKTAPPDVVADFTIPDPHTKLLQAGISCIRCHAIDKANGWQDLPNDVNTLLKSGVVDIVDTKADLLASRYSGVLTKPLSRARDDLAEALTRITGLADSAEGTVVYQVHGGIGKLVNEYQYTRITAELAAVELGVASLDNINMEGVEDNIIAILRAGLTVSRGQFEKVYVDMALRLNSAK